LKNVLISPSNFGKWKHFDGPFREEDEISEQESSFLDNDEIVLIYEDPSMKVEDSVGFGIEFSMTYDMLEMLEPVQDSQFDELSPLI
jgi:hypothetical protein